MSHWNHRVMRSETSYGIHEVYYRDDGTVHGWTDPVAPYGESLDELTRDLANMILALYKSVLDADTGDEL